jgi:cytochrome c553
MKKITLAVLGVACLAAGGVAGAADVHTRTIAATCMSCHGPNGNSLTDIPSLAGIDKDSFVKKMQGFKSGERKGTIMKKHAAGYTDAEFAALGEYFASLK